MKSKAVRIFVDFWNLALAWEKKLPGLIMDKLDEKGYLDKENADLRGITVYASTHPEPTDEHRQQEHWLLFKLDQMPGYTVKTCVRQRQPCDHNIHEAHYVEKGVDTMLVCDMLSLAMRNLYEVGVVISDDSDLVPSIQSVQDVLDRQMVHVGFKKESRGLVRSAAWAHLLLDELSGQLKLRQPQRRPHNALANALHGLVNRNENGTPVDKS